MLRICARLVWLALVACCVAGAAAEPLERTVRFAGADGVTLVGTITAPVELDIACPDAPALLLLQGSGPTDRNGNQPPLLMSNLLRQLARLLAERGIVTLRYDKRGLHGNAALGSSDDALRTTWSRWENFTGDARAALHFLRALPGVNARRVGIFGHSEGGLVALDVAAEADETVKPRVLVLAGTPGRRANEVIEEQLVNTLRETGASDAMKQFYIASVRQAQRAIAATGEVPANMPYEISRLFPRFIGGFMKSLFALDPLRLAQIVRRPTLVINGADDRQISAERDGRAFSSILTGRMDGSEVIIPRGVSHNLKPANRDFAGITGEVDETVADELTAWLKLHL